MTTQWYLSFVDVSEASGEKWLGACVVEAANACEAYIRACSRGLNPGGGLEVAVVEIRGKLPDEFTYRMLSHEEATNLPRPT